MWCIIHSLALRAGSPASQLWSLVTYPALHPLLMSEPSSLLEISISSCQGLWLVFQIVSLNTHPVTNLWLIITYLGPHPWHWPSILTSHVISIVIHTYPHQWAPTLPCILMSPGYQGWSCCLFLSCCHLRICQTINKNNITRLPRLCRQQVLLQCLQARAWVSWPWRSPISPLALNWSSSSHSIFFYLVAVSWGHYYIIEHRTPNPHMDPRAMFWSLGPNCYLYQTVKFQCCPCIDSQDQNCPCSRTWILTVNYAIQTLLWNFNLTS